MTPKEKAKELVDKYFILLKNKYQIWNIAYGVGEPKQCALIVVDEILEELDAEYWGLEMDRSFERQRFWLNVKHEIEKL